MKVLVTFASNNKKIPLILSWVFSHPYCTNTPFPGILAPLAWHVHPEFPNSLQEIDNLALSANPPLAGNLYSAWKEKASDQRRCPQVRGTGTELH